jgi:hypothetical protein
MAICRFCRNELEQEGHICPFCGYDPATDTVNQAAKSQIEQSGILGKKNKEKEKKAGGGGVNPKIKRFAFIGLAVIVFSVFYKHNFDINGVIYEITQNISRIKEGKLFSKKSDKDNDREAKKIELIDVRSYNAPERQDRSKELVVEGIFLDPQTKSFVIINGKVITEGESYRGAIVARIKEDSVELIVGNETKILKAYQRMPFIAK